MSKYVTEYMGHIVPKGASHQSKSFISYFYKYIGDSAYFFLNQEWKKSSACSVYLKDNLKPLPLAETVEWMPEVGVECEFKSIGHHEGFQWGIFQGFISDASYIIEYHHQTSPVRTTCCPFDPNLTSFCPIKTAEELEREAFHLFVVDACMGISNHDFNIDNIAMALFNAGFTAPKGD